MLLFANLVPEQVPPLPADGQAVYLRRLWQGPGSGEGTAPSRSYPPCPAHAPFGGRRWQWGWTSAPCPTRHVTTARGSLRTPPPFGLAPRGTSFMCIPCNAPPPSKHTANTAAARQGWRRPGSPAPPPPPFPDPRPVVVLLARPSFHCAAHPPAPPHGASTPPARPPSARSSRPADGAAADPGQDPRAQPGPGGGAGPHGPGAAAGGGHKPHLCPMRPCPVHHHGGFSQHKHCTTMGVLNAAVMAGVEAARARPPWGRCEPDVCGGWHVGATAAGPCERGGAATPRQGQGMP